MKEVRILDGTLRDGGYCNDWNFGKRNIEKIVDALSAAGIGIIEYGYLDENCAYSENSTRFPNLNRLPLNTHTQNLVMINYGQVNIDNIPLCDGRINGLRVAFHKKDRKNAVLYCKALRNKGYDVYVQPMVTNSYTLEEFRDMLEEINDLQPAAFYLVDSFGSIQEKELAEYLEITTKLLKKEIGLGFHGHDNSKAAFVNARIVIDKCDERIVYIDSSIMGMGRGAGNLCTEIIIEYCNLFWNTEYSLYPILKNIDEVINHFYAESAWGYTLSYYLAAHNNCHPNYATYLDNKKTLTVTNMNDIFKKFSHDKRVSFDEMYIEKLYKEYMERDYYDRENDDIWRKRIENRNILFIAPGKTISAYKERIMEYIKEKDPVIISINFDDDSYPIDFVFMSNLRRYQELNDRNFCSNEKLIVTSNIPEKKYFMKIRYSDLLSKQELISDNAGLMAINFLLQYPVKQIALAGYDGYRHDEQLNYFDKRMRMETVNERKCQLNTLVREELLMLEKQVDIVYLTPSVYKKERYERNFI